MGIVIRSATWGCEVCQHSSPCEAQHRAWQGVNVNSRRLQSGGCSLKTVGREATRNADVEGTVPAQLPLTMSTSLSLQLLLSQSQNLVYTLLAFLGPLWLLTLWPHRQQRGLLCLPSALSELPASWFLMSPGSPSAPC